MKSQQGDVALALKNLYELVVERDPIPFLDIVRNDDVVHLVSDRSLNSVENLFADSVVKQLPGVITISLFVVLVIPVILGEGLELGEPITSHLGNAGDDLVGNEMKIFELAGVLQSHLELAGVGGNETGETSPCSHRTAAPQECGWKCHPSEQ